MIECVVIKEFVVHVLDVKLKYLTSQYLLLEKEIE